MPDPVSLLHRIKRKTLNQLRSWFDRSDPEACGPTGLAKNWISYQDYCQQEGTWYLVYPSLSCYWDKNRSHNWGKLSVDFTKNLRSHIPETGVLEIPKGQVMDIQGYTLTGNDFFLPDLSYHRNRLEYAHLPSVKYPIEKIEGTCFSLMTNASNNYCHFLLDSLTRLHLFEKAGFSLDQVDWILAPKPISENAWNIFRQLGINESKCIWSERQRGIQADRLIATTHPGLQAHYPRWVVDFMQQRVKLEPSQPQRRLYIPRKTGTRKIANESELYPLLKKYGFELYNPDQEPYQPQVFHEAAIIVAPHGAALTNLVFCQPGTKLLELMSAGHLKPYFFALSQVIGLEHHYIVGATTEPLPKRRGLCKFDFTIEPSLLNKALAELVS
ncbi:glycosyltransferase family 61 protein [Spirulina subsalsa]|uniref:glycosyltransferase family 61 protein n=1 Tax=Spirulina subsalsa TaxID=54311 RepID=UPI0002E6D337|nr:glycosyltransferase family 61 protein [Spirulina subsalsa]